MNTTSHERSRSDAAGITLIEVLIALVVLSVGIISIGRVLPAGSRSEMSSRMQSNAVEYGSEVFESARGLPRTDPSLGLGRHPAVAYDTLGALKSWRRYYVVSQMPAPLDSLLKIRTTVLWRDTKPESVAFVSYVRP